MEKRRRRVERWKRGEEEKRDGKSLYDRKEKKGRMRCGRKEERKKERMKEKKKEKKGEGRERRTENRESGT